MPCGLTTGMVSEYAEEDRARTVRRIARLTRLLCEVTKLLTEEQVSRLSPDYHKWRRGHEAVDAKRRKEARQRRRQRDIDKRVEEFRAKLEAGRPSCPKCGRDLVRVKGHAWVCPMNQPYQGCGYRVTDADLRKKGGS